MKSHSSGFSSHIILDLPAKSSRKTKKNSKQVDLEDVCKHYVSLQDIILDEEERLNVSL